MNTEELIGVFRAILELDDITADSDFFELGGDSLLATRVLSRVARSTGVELTFDEFVSAPTPGALAKRLTTMAAS